MLSQQTLSNPSSPPPLKRTRPMDPPPLPRINGDLTLQVFTHRSLRRAGSPLEFDDGERLAELGVKALEVAVTWFLFKKKPMLQLQELLSERDAALSHENLRQWMSLYGMQEKLRCQPELYTKLRTAEETKKLFHAFVGAVFLDLGADALNNWIYQLMNPTDTIDMSRTISSNTSAAQYNSTSSIMLPATPTPPAFKKIKSEMLDSPMGFQSPPRPPIFYASQPPPPSSSYTPSQQQTPQPQFQFISLKQQPANYPSPSFSRNNYNSNLPSYQNNPLAPAQPGLAFLPLFNQTASQRRVTVEYPAAFNGPPHAGRWHVRCVVNGIPKGDGTGTTKQIAKEEAARQAYYAMGWAPSG